ncbi:MAG: hypothetical protein ACREM3_23650 [Candidatus Rokuibacteriota bacterium]
MLTAIARAVGIPHLIYPGERWRFFLDADGGLLTDDHVAALADVPLSAPGVRRVQLVVIDAGPLARDLEGTTLRPETFRIPRQLPLCYQLQPGRDLTVGGFEDVELRAPGAIAGTIGPCLVGTARLAETVLAASLWRAVRGGVLTGGCL